MTRATIGRISHPDSHGVEWIYDTTRKGFVEFDHDELERQIGRSMRAIDREQIGLVQAVRHARARGFSWARIGVILGVSREVAQYRFNQVDEELRSQGAQLPDDAAPEAERAPQDAPQPPVNLAAIELAPVPADPAIPKPPQFDFSAMNTMTEDEIVAMANQLPVDAKLFDPYLSALREAIVVTLYKRGMKQPEIALVIKKSSQRVSQIVTGYYDRLERTWKAERAQWQKED